MIPMDAPKRLPNISHQTAKKGVQQEAYAFTICFILLTNYNIYNIALLKNMPILSKKY
jgi:hypothetical protein